MVEEMQLYITPKIIFDPIHPIIFHVTKLSPHSYGSPAEEAMGQRDGMWRGAEE